MISNAPHLAGDTVPFLQLNQLQRHFTQPGRRFWHPLRDYHALQNVTASLNSHERVGLVGASGAGKSTLLKVLLGLDAADSGEVYCQGRLIHPNLAHTRRWYRRQVQYIPQDPASTLAPHKTVAESIAEPLHHLTKERANPSLLLRALDDVALPAALMNQRVGSLSGGQAQRVAIARALVVRPAFLVADEPVSGLDLPLRQQISQLFIHLSQQYNMGLLLVSHDISAVSALCQRVLVMYEGEIVEDRPVHALLRQPAHPHTQELLSAIPSLSDFLC